MVWTPTSGGKELTTYLSYLYKSCILVKEIILVHIYAKKKNKKNYNNRFKELKYIQHTYKLKQFCFIIINKYSIYSFFFYSTHFR